MTAVDDELVEVRLLGFPLDVYERAQEHGDGLVRELMLIAQSSPQEHEVPVRLTAIVTELSSRFAGFGDDTDAVRDAAIDRGEQSIDLEYLLPRAAGAACVHLGDILDEADEYCRQGEHLLSLTTPPESPGLPALVPRRDRAAGRRRCAHVLAGPPRRAPLRLSGRAGSLRHVSSPGGSSTIVRTSSRWTMLSVRITEGVGPTHRHRPATLGEHAVRVREEPEPGRVHEGDGAHVHHPVERAVLSACGERGHQPVDCPSHLRQLVLDGHVDLAGHGDGPRACE